MKYVASFGLRLVDSKRIPARPCLGPSWAIAPGESLREDSPIYRSATRGNLPNTSKLLCLSTRS